MTLREKILERAYQFDNDEGKKVYNIFSILNDMKKFKNLDYWDAKDSDGDFDRWCDSKGYPEVDPKGKNRRQSNIWFAEQQKEIKDGLWISPQYCPFIDIFVDGELYPELLIPQNYMRGDEYADLNFKELLSHCEKLDIEEYGKEDYRVTLAKELKDLFIDDFSFTTYQE
jgi:hypothetical protein